MLSVVANPVTPSVSTKNGAAEGSKAYPFRPWARRAGVSILGVPAAATAGCLIALFTTRGGRWGWAGEATVWLYLLFLWLGGLKVTLSTLAAVVEMNSKELVLRPPHAFRVRRIDWRDLLGTEQMRGGDRLIVYYNGSRGMRFVALNLNLVKGRSDFVKTLDRRLVEAGFRERIVGRSRYLSHPDRNLSAG